MSDAKLKMNKYKVLSADCKRKIKIEKQNREYAREGRKR